MVASRNLHQHKILSKPILFTATKYAALIDGEARELMKLRRVKTLDSIDASLYPRNASKNFIFVVSF